MAQVAVAGRPAIAAGLSVLLPGLGQAFNGERSKAASALTVSVGLLATVVLVHVVARASYASEINAVTPLYALIWVPAVVDAWSIAKGGRTRLLGGESRAYVIAMLSCVGPLALPLLWQSPCFGRASKVIWTAFIVLSVAAAIRLTMALAPLLDELLRDLATLQSV